MEGIVRIRSKVLDEDVLLVHLEPALKEARKMSKKLGLVLYAPKEIERIQTLGGTPEVVREVHTLKKKYKGTLTGIEDGRPKVKRLKA